ncbi:hypothetical protein Tco_0927446 [Tanacetum coccineum]
MISRVGSQLLSSVQLINSSKLLKELKPSESNHRLGIFFSKEILRAGMIRIYTVNLFMKRPDVFFMTLPQDALKAKSLASHISSIWFIPVWGNRMGSLG